MILYYCAVSDYSVLSVWSGTICLLYPASFYNYSQTCLKRPLKIDETKVLMENGSLMKVTSIAECSHWSILQYFWPALSDNRYWKPVLVFFLSGRLRHVLL